MTELAKLTTEFELVKGPSWHTQGFDDSGKAAEDGLHVPFSEQKVSVAHPLVQGPSDVRRILQCTQSGHVRPH